jgi:hypothetical protein
MKLPRFTVRGMMLAVAVIAIVIGADNMRRRRDHYLEARALHELMERNYREAADFYASSADQNERESRRLRAAGVPSEGHPQSSILGAIESHAADQRLKERAALDQSRRRGLLRRKYELAARSPGLPVAPDPPEPE